jgi:signal transduction histidine kinase
MLQTIFDGISDPLVMFDNDMKVRMLNRSAVEYYNVEFHDVIGRRCYQAFKGRSGPCEECNIPSAIIGGRSVTFERRGFMDPRRSEQVVIYPIRERDSEAGSAIKRISDVTEARRMERQLMQSEKLASLGFLVSGVAHEINNPNNFITFNLPILRDYLQEIIPIIDDYADEHQDFELFDMSYPEFRKDIFKLLDNIEHGSKRINTTVSSLREFSRNKDKVEKYLVDIGQVIEKGLAISRGEIRRMVKSFEVNIPEGLPRINTDPQILEHILINLLINAAQAADKEDSWVRVSVSLGNTWWDHLNIEVSDNGCGMDKETIGKIFDPFFTTKPSGKGTGVGLSVCHTQVESLGGRIEVESEPGKGSTFRVILTEKNRRRVKR